MKTNQEHFVSSIDFYCVTFYSLPCPDDQQSIVPCITILVILLKTLPTFCITLPL